MKFFWLSVIALMGLTMCNMPGKDKAPLSVLVFSKTAGYRHDCIPAAIDALKGLALENRWNLQTSEDSLLFTKDNLALFDVVVFLHTSGDILDVPQQEAFENFIETGNGLVTIHSGTVTENSWDWYVEAVGAKFTGHPPVQSGKLIIEERGHPATSFFPDTVWIINDEWYSFDRNPRDSVRVLVSIDETSYNVDDNRWFPDARQRMGDHPLVWYRDVGKGRVFQTALGHDAVLYSDTLFLKHLAGAINWAGIK